MAEPRFHLNVTTEPDDAVVRLRLRDDDGRHLAGHSVRLTDHSPALWEGLFDTRVHVARYAGGTRFTAERATPEDLLARLGVFLGRDVLGSELTALLHQGIGRRTLVVQFPAATAEDALAAAFARVPWEIARPTADATPLMHRNLAVRTVLADADNVLTTPAVHTDEPVRVLLVYAEAPGSRPLAMRLEREKLLGLFHDHILPKRQVDVHVLCHGVSRAALEETVTRNDGFHVIHWSGHGHRDVLERALGLALGPLPAAEAMIFLQGTAALRRLLHGDAASRQLVLRLLEVSRGHPLVLSRLGALADEPEALARALDKLQAEGFGHLPDLFAERLSDAERESERVYLEDVAMRSVDLLLERASVDARRLLWVVTLASEPVAEELIAHAWSERRRLCRCLSSWWPRAC